MSDEMPEGLSPQVRDVLAVFDDTLSDVRFGEIDAARLREVATRVRATELEVEEARDRLDAAKRVFEEELAGLTSLAQRALAYARIYAESDPALAERLAPLAEKEKAPKRKKRRKKQASAEVQTLPLEEPPLKIAVG